MLRKYYVLLLVLLLITGLIYSLGVGGPLVLDDMANLDPINKLQNGLVPWYAVVLTNISGTFGRPVSMLSFLANYWLFGFNVTAFKATNIVLHLACGAALFQLLKRMLRDTAYANDASWIALLTCGCWLLSPFYASTVLYVVQRMAMLSTLFVLLSLLAYLDFRRGLSVRQFRIRSLLLFGITAVLGVLSKESAALLPLFILILEIFYCARIEDTLWRRRLYWISSVLVGLPIVAAIVMVALKSNVLLNYGIRSFTLGERLLTEARILWLYLAELVLPTSNRFGLFHDDIIISKSSLNPPQTLIAIIGWVVVFVAVIWARKYPRIRPIAGGFAFYIAGHAMESSIFPLELYFEHRNYLPGAGIYLALALTGSYLVNQKYLTLNLAKVVVVTYLAAFALALSQRALIWSNYATIIYSSYDTHPNSPRASVEAALLDAQLGRFEEALKKLQKVKELNPDKQLGVNVQLIYTYCLFNKPGLQGQIENLVNVPLDDSPYTATAITELNSLYRKSPCTNVPYAEYILALSNRLERFYHSGEYKTFTAQKLLGISTIQLRTLEGLNMIARTDKTLELARAINVAGQGGFGVDMLTTVALIDQNKLNDAALLIDKLKQDKNMFALMEAGHLEDVEDLYKARAEKVK